MKVLSWMHTATCSQTLVHSKCWPFPTMTRKGVEVVRRGKPRVVTTWGWTKLCVLPPSTRMVTQWSAIRPASHSVSGARWPERELRLIWSWNGIGLSSGSGFRCRLVGSIWGQEGWSSSVIRRRTLEAQRCPLWYFSLQVKHKLRSWREDISSRINRRSGSGGGRGGDGNIGACEVGRNGRGVRVCGRSQGGGRQSDNFSSWRQARPVAWTRVRGWWACTSCRMSDARPEMKQARRNGGGKPMMQFAKFSNSDKYSATEPFCVSLNNAPVGSTYWDGANRVGKACKNAGHEVNCTLVVMYWNQANTLPSI